MPETFTVTSSMRSISHLAGAANSKRAVFLRACADKEAELIGKVKRGRRYNPETGRNRPQSRFTTPPSFSKPSPLGGRSEVGGMRPFSFDMNTIHRPSGHGGDGGRHDTNGSGKTSKQPGIDHARYIEREHAAEVVTQSDQETYLNRHGAVELHAAVAPITLDEACAALGVPELDDRGSAPVVGGILAVISNISDDQWERQKYWTLVQQHERQTRTACLIADPSRSPQWWAAVKDGPWLDKELGRHLVGEFHRHAAHAASGSNERFEPKPFKVPADKANRYLNNLPRGGLRDDEPTPIWAQTRHGRVQKRMVIELPHEATAAERLEIARSFCSKLERVEPNESGKLVGWMYTAVIHAPDGNNDRRNYHLHVIAHDRPSRFLTDYNQWDFAVAETFTRRGEVRTRYPFRQPKLVSVSQSGRAKDRSGTSLHGRADAGRNYPKHLRAQFAESVNEVMERTGSSTRFHPGTNAECGIERSPTEHLGDAHKREQIGVETEVGTRNAEVIWADEERAVRVRHDRARAETSALLDRASDVLRRTRSQDLLVQRHKLEQEAARVHAERLALDLFDLEDRRSRSRAKVVLAYCTDALEGRRSTARQAQKDAQGLIQRRDEAQEFLAELARLTAPERDELALLARNLESAERRLEDQMAELAAEVLAESGKEPVRRPVLASDQIVDELSTVAVEDAPEPSGAMPAIPGSNEREPALRGSRLPELEPVIANGRHYPVDEATPEPATPARRGIEETPSADDEDLAEPETAVPSITAPGASEVVQSGTSAVPRTERPAITAAPEPRDDVKGPPSPPPRVQTRPPPTTVAQVAREVAINQVDVDPARKETIASSRPMSPAAAAPARGKAMEPRLPRKRPVRPELDLMIDRVARERIPIVPVRGGGQDRFTVPSLETDFDALKLRLDEAAHKQKRLAGIFRNQQREIARLRSWFEQLPALEKGNPREAVIHAPVAVQTLYRHWGGRLSLSSTSSEESERDIEPAMIADQNARSEAVEPVPVHRSSHREKRNDTEEDYPDRPIAPDEGLTVEQMISYFQKYLGR